MQRSNGSRIGKHRWIVLVTAGLAVVALMAAVAAACGGDDGMGGMNHDMNGMDSTDTGAMDMSDDDMNGTSGGDMGAMPGMEPIPDAGVPAATESQGALPLSYALDGDVKVFALTARPVRWKLTGDVTMTAWTYNGTIPGPMIRVTEGDKVRVTVKNELPEATSIHWHGIPVPNAMDGVPPFTQTAIETGQSFTYEFTASPAGSFMYHSHVETDKQIPLGLYAPFIIEPKDASTARLSVDKVLMLSEVRIGADGKTYAAMPMAGAEPNYFTINGKSFPDTEKIQVKRGEVVRLRLENVGQLTHPMHLHGSFFKVVATDGNPVPEGAQLTKDTIAVNPGERYDVEFVADNPGTWVLHCHVLHHVTNDNVEPGGLITVIEVS